VVSGGGGLIQTAEGSAWVQGSVSLEAVQRGEERLVEHRLPVLADWSCRPFVNTKAPLLKTVIARSCVSSNHKRVV
jgi:hypothetical protein